MATSREELTPGKDSDAGRDWGQEEKGTTEDEMAGWHHRLDGHEFGWIPGVGDGQGGLACCDSRLPLSPFSPPDRDRRGDSPAWLNMPAHLENSAVAIGLEKVSFHSNPKDLPHHTHTHTHTQSSC